MKIFTFIMACMVLVFSCMPCMDESIAANETESASVFTASNNQQEHNDDTDNCSPFCTCNCCAGFSFLFTLHHTTTPPLASSEKETFHLPAAISNIALPVWQPPQLS